MFIVECYKMEKSINQYLGIDIGGTNVKMALVNGSGEIANHKKFSTASLKEDGNFVEGLLKIIKSYLKDHPDVEKVGIGVPGTLSKDRSTTLEVPAISQLDGVDLLQRLQEHLPGKKFILENDANAAALGEYFFPKDKVRLPENFIFLTMGTGIGGAAIIDGNIFLGGEGNGMEIGHMLSRESKELEKNIGKQGIINLAKSYLNKSKEKNESLNKKKLTTSHLVLSAEKGNKLALEVFKTVGQILGEALVSIIRVLDIKTIVIGGGLSDSFNYIIESLKDVLNQHLTPYYTTNLFIKRATLANQAGIIGAASLCF